MQKVYFLPVMPVCVGLIMLAAYFRHSCLSQVKCNCSLIKMDWLATCIALRLVGAGLIIFLWRWRKICTILHPMGSKGPIPEEIYQTILTNKKETWIKYTLLAVPVRPTQTRINREKFTLFRYKIIGAPKKFKNWPRPSFRSRTDHARSQKPNPSRETVPLNQAY